METSEEPIFYAQENRARIIFKQPRVPYADRNTSPSRPLFVTKNDHVLNVI